MTVRHGCADVAGKYPDRSGTQDFLTYTANLPTTVGAGFNSIKVYLSPNYKGDLDAAKTDYPNQTWSGAHADLTSLAGDTAFNTVFSAYSRVFINTWTFANGINNPWVNNISTTQLANEYTEIYNLVVYLLTTYSGKEFVIQNWEGSWELLGAFDPHAVIDPYRVGRMVAFLNARQRAVQDARAATPSTSTVYHAVEINRCLDDYGFRLHRDVLPKVNCDAISWSAYEAINTWGSGQADAEANIASLMTKGFNRVRAALQAYPGAPFTKRFYIGEFGWPENDAGFISLGLDVGALIQKAIDTANTLGVTDMIYWQICDNEENSPGVPRGYNIYTRNGSSTTVGALSGAGTKYAAIL